MALTRASALHRRRDVSAPGHAAVLAGDAYYAAVAEQVRALEGPVQAHLDAHPDLAETAQDEAIRESLVRPAVQWHNRAALERRLPPLPEEAAVRDIFGRLRRGDGLLTALIEDAPAMGVTDIFINGPDLPVWIERHGQVEQLDLTLSAAEIDAYVEKWIDDAQHPLNAVNWRVTARRPGLRVTLLHESVARLGRLVALRIHPPAPLLGSDLLTRGLLPAAAWDFLLSLFGPGAANLVVGGPMGSGKTTLMQALLCALGPACRIATIETAHEVLLGPHVVQLECRAGQPGDPAHKGEVTPRELVQESLRLGVQRVVVGESRGAEAFDMLMAMSMGHAGSTTTVHGATPSEVLNRLVLLCLLAEKPAEVAYELIAQAVDLIAVVEKRAEGRRLTALAELVGRVGPHWSLQELLVWEDGRLCRTRYEVSERLRQRVAAAGGRLPTLDALPLAHGASDPLTRGSRDSLAHGASDLRMHGANDRRERGQGRV